MPSPHGGRRTGSARRRFRAATVGLWAIGILSPAARADDPAATLLALRRATVAPETAVEVRARSVAVGPATLDIETGWLVAARSPGQPTRELVFVGRGRLRLEAPDAIEAGQLELFTGRRALEEPIEAAVLTFSRAEDAATALVGPAGGAGPGVLAAADRLYTEWRERPERRSVGGEAAMMRDALGEPAERGFAAVWCRSRDLGDFLFRYDPTQEEQSVLVQFVPADLRPWEIRRVRNLLRSEQSEGRSLQVRLQDLGSWDVWISATDAGSGGAAPGNEGVEPVGYVIDAKIDPLRERVAGTERIEIEPLRDGVRVVGLEVHGDVVIDRVADRRGGGAAFFRSGERVWIALERPLDRGETAELEIAFSGRMLQRVSTGLYALRDTSRWYPHCGTTDRATYDVTLHWPERVDVVSGGSLVAGGTEGEIRWERRRVERPAVGFSFEVGEFAMERASLGPVAVRVAFDRSVSGIPAPARREVVDTVLAVLRTFREAFGDYPERELTVTTAPRGFSQSFPGYVTLAESTLTREDADDWDRRRRQRQQTTAHKTTHQWWGNLVGWRSYRDQWLSEAMANYASLLFLERSDGGGGAYVARMAAGWRGSLGVRIKDGRTLESLGPLVLGRRLSSSKSSEAYRAIVYRKGAVVLAMLARELGNDTFHDSLREVLRECADRAISTGQFVDELERLSGRELDDFARQYVYGTGVPEVYYTHESERDASGNWVVRGEIHQASSFHNHYAVVRAAEGRWDVRRARIDDLDVGRSRLVVPLRIEYALPEDGAAGDEAGRTGTIGRLDALLSVEGERQLFALRVPGEPRRLRLDPGGEVLANFHDAGADPKSALQAEAQILEERGDVEAADRVLREALAAGRLPAGRVPREARRERRIRDARILLDLARLHLDRGLDVEAADALRRGLRTLPFGVRPWMRLDIAALEARLALRSGRVREAWAALRPVRGLLGAPHHSGNPRALQIERHLRQRQDVLAESTALLAVAATLSGRPREARRAVAEAIERGCDLGALRERLDPEAVPGAP